MEDSKEDYTTYKGDQNRLMQNLRLQMDETREMIDRIRETKDRELKRMRDKFDDERRKEAEKYQFEYDKLREEIQLFARKLGQEENLNKQLSMLNYKLQGNLTEVGKGFAAARHDDEATFLEGGLRFHPSFEVDNDVSDELYQRKKAWADLEREGDEVRHNIKSLMRKEPQSTEISNPLLSDVVRPKTQEPGAYRVPQDVMLEEKHGKQFSNFDREAAVSRGREPKASSP